MRSLLQHRKDKDAPVNLMINSPGGDVHEMLGIIDYIEQVVKIQQYKIYIIWQKYVWEVYLYMR